MFVVQSIFKPKFSTIDPTPKQQDNVLNSSVDSSAFEGKREYEIVKPPIKRKLVLELDDAHDEVTNGCKDNMLSVKKHFASNDGVQAVNNICVHGYIAGQNYPADPCVEQAVEGMKVCIDAESAAEEQAHIIKVRNAEAKGKGLLHEVGAEVVYEPENHTHKFAAGCASNGSSDYASVGLISESTMDDVAEGFELIEKSEVEYSLPEIGGSNAVSTDVYQLTQNFDCLYKSAIVGELMNLDLHSQNSVDICGDHEAMLGLDEWIEINGIGIEDQLFQP